MFHILASFSLKVQVSTNTMNRTFLAFSRLCLFFLFNSIVNYVLILASQHVFRLYLFHSVYMTHCFIRSKCKYDRGCKSSCSLDSATLSSFREICQGFMANRMDKKPLASEDIQKYFGNLSQFCRGEYHRYKVMR